MSAARKGPAFERWFCTRLSQWWTNGERDDIFWRTAGSGARATVRSKKNRRTSGQYGDITAIDPDGVPFTNLFVVELKHGYSNQSIIDLVDISERAHKRNPLYQIWVDKLIKNKEDAGISHWLLVTKRNTRTPLVFFPREVVDLIKKDCKISPAIIIAYPPCGYIGGMELKEFFSTVSPHAVKLWAGGSVEKKVVEENSEGSSLS